MSESTRNTLFTAAPHNLLKSGLGAAALAYRETLAEPPSSIRNPDA